MSAAEPVHAGMEQPTDDLEGPVLSEGAREIARRIIAKYPSPRSALVPLLYLVQSEVGWVPHQGMREVAGLLGLKTAEVEAVATFYTMVKLHPAGRYVLSFCTNPACSLAGGKRLYERARELLGDAADHGATDDGLFTIEEEECMAACDRAPVVSVNYIYYDRMARDELERLIADVRGGGAPPEAPRGAGVPGDLREVSRLLAGIHGLRPEGSHG